MTDQRTAPRRRTAGGSPTPARVRALAHAGRYAILERLQTDGPATATECAQVAGLSPSACSYHLRLLAKYGFVEPDDTRDRDGRERVWRAAITGWLNDPEPDADPHEVQAIDSTLARVMIASSDRKVLEFARPRRPAEREWRDAALFSNSTIIATAEELRELSDAMMALLRPLHEDEPAARRRPRGRPAGAPRHPDGPPPPLSGAFRLLSGPETSQNAPLDGVRG